MARTVSVAVVQLAFTNYNATLDKAISSIKSAKADIILFSEYFLGWNVPPNVIRTFKRLAREFSVHIILGSIPFKTDGKIYNSTFLISRDGELVGRYDKLHPYLEWEKIDSGKKQQIFDLGGLKVGVSICLDIYFPNEFSMLRDADLIVVPSMTSKEEIKDHLCVLKTRSIENIVPIILCNALGSVDLHGQTVEWGGRSAYIDCQGRIMLDPRNEEGCFTFSVDLDKKDMVRKQLKRVFNLE